MRGLLAVATGEGGPALGDERELARALDRLAFVMHGLEPGEPQTEALAPGSDYGELRARIGARFPGLGWYREGSLELGGELLAGDALDDLTDIAVDLSEVLWLLEHAGEADARLQLRFDFEFHWARHLRCLQWYLQARTTD